MTTRGHKSTSPSPMAITFLSIKIKIVQMVTIVTTIVIIAIIEIIVRIVITMKPWGLHLWQRGVNRLGELLTSNSKISYRVIQGLYWDNGKENGNYCILLGYILGLNNYQYYGGETTKCGLHISDYSRPTFL